jgi:hypothetical protein
MARNWKREWMPRAIETLWRKQYIHNKDKVPIVHLSAKEPDEFDL